MSILTHPPPALPHVVLTLCQLAFGGLHVSTKTALLYLPPFTFGALRVLLALPALWMFARGVEPGPHPCSAWDIAVHIFLGITGITGPQGLILVGVRMTSPDVVAIFQPTIPVLVALLAGVLGLERFTFRKGIGIGFAVSGALVMLDVAHIDLHSTQTVGMLVMLAQVSSYSVFIIMLSHYLKRVPRPFTVFCRASAAGAAMLAVIATTEAPMIAWAEVPTVAWLILVYCALVVSFMAHSSVSWAVQHMSATIPSLYACLQPAAVMIMSWIVYGDVLELVDLVGMCLILTGLFVTVTGQPVPPDAIPVKAAASTEESHLIQQVELQEDQFSGELETTVTVPKACCEGSHSLAFPDGATVPVADEQ